ncbi:MAG: ArsR/SmtB family transcription factor [Verrucomicrobiales bacterium]
MNWVSVYRCLCDKTRLRIINLLLEGPLCVCHLAAILDLSQPKISRHLKMLKEAKAIETVRCYNWTICNLPAKPNRLLEVNLKCLQDLRGEDPVFTEDLVRREAIIERMSSECEDLPEQIRCLCLKSGEG